MISFEMFLYFLIGCTGGLTVASWHGFKDPPWEGFFSLRFLRSIIIAGIIAVFLLYLQDLGFLEKIDNLGVVFLSALSLERLVGEIRKGFLRKSIHPEFERVFVIWKLPIYYRSFLVRIAIGIIITLMMLLVLIFYIKLPDYLSSFMMNKGSLSILLGFIGGMSSAIAGAWKDSPQEGFLIKKFVRSPIAGIIGGAIIGLISNSLSMFIIASIGFERIAVEFYKTFWTKSPRGMFKGKRPKHPEWFKKRWIFFVSYSIGVIILALALIFA